MSKIENLDKFVNAFKKMGELDKKEVKKLTVNGAEIILSAAKRRCQSTTVRNALGFITKNDSKYPYTTLIGVKGGNSTGTKTITTPALAVMLEFGTVERIKKDGSSTGRINPRPFMRNSVDENKEKVVSIIKDGMIDLINKQYKNNIK